MPVENYDVVIGLEAHAHLLTKTKMFCSCATSFGAPPNTHTCPVCIGMPGTLPVINKTALMLALTSAVAFRCDIPHSMRFDRKNYYYPDLPKNYQISQNYTCLGTGGFVEIETPAGRKQIRLDNIHLEEDAGKLLHPEGSGASYSQVDLNRAGTPLLEIVTRPDMSTLDEVEAYMETLRRTLEALDISDCKMQEGSLRFEASVSLKPTGAPQLGNRVEVKNLNSTRAVLNSLKYEISRQAKALDADLTIDRETRLWNENASRSERMRSKEAAQDYRYFPEPDLGPITVLDSWLSDIRSSLPELPNERKWRFESDYALPSYDAAVLTQKRSLADYFEAALDAAPPAADKNAFAKQVSNWLMGPVLKLLNENNIDVSDFTVPPAHLAALVSLIHAGTVSNNIAQDLLPLMLHTGKPPDDLAREKGMLQITDTSRLETIVDSVLAENPKPVADYRSGKTAVIGFLVGQVMRQAKGKANPQLAREILVKKLDI